MQPITIIEKLTTATSRVRKEQIIFEAYQQNCSDFFAAIKLATDPFVVFDLKRVGEILEDDGAAGSFSFAEFTVLCDQLRHKALTDDAARECINQAAERCHAPTWNQLYRPILLKELNSEIIVIVEKVLKRLGPAAQSYRSQRFSPQIATPMKAIKLSGCRLVEAQISGTRLLAVLDRTIRFYTLDGQLDRGSELDHALKPLIGWLPAPIVLDGVRTDAGVYIIFDLIPLVDFRNYVCNKSLRERHAVLTTLHRAGAFAESRSLRVLPQIEINFSQPEAGAALAEMMALSRAEGAKALMLKKPEAPYASGKNTNWQAQKICTVDLSNS